MENPNSKMPILGGRYQLIKLIGQGGFANVYLGEHVHLGSKHAIKILRGQLTGRDETQNFLNEARNLSSLRHPHIVRVTDYDIEHNIPFLVMDYMTPLRENFPRGTRLPLPTVVSYVKQSASALQYAHDAEKPIIHRDVKPENMLLGNNDEILLSDFGIAIIAATYLQGTQDAAGSPPYMSPEQIQGKAGRRSDQYSLGVVTYEWLTGAYPFQGTVQEICMQHLTVPPPPLREKVPCILPAVEQVVLKALEKNPDDRYPNVTAFAEALDQASALPGETYYPEEVARAMRECYYQWCDKADWGEMMEVGLDDARHLQHKRSNKQVTVGFRWPFTNGAIFWSERGGTQPVWGGFNQLLNNEGGVEDTLGFPLTSELPAASSPQETEGVFQRFEGRWDYPEEINTNPIRCGATLYCSRYGAYPTWGGIGICFERLGGISSPLGFPRSPEMDAGPSWRGTKGKYQCFEGGYIYWSWKTNAHPIWGAISELYHNLNGPNNRLGFPLTGEEPVAESPQKTSGVFQRFEGRGDNPEDIPPFPVRYGSSIYHSDKYGAYQVWGGIELCYERLGGTASQLGFPISAEREAEKPSPQGTSGWYQHFEGGDIYYIDRGDIDKGNYDGFAVIGPILEVFNHFDGIGGKFGFPLSPQTSVEGHIDMYQQEFEGGTICVVQSKGN